MQSDLLSIADVARLAGISPASVRRYRVRGSIPPEDETWMGHPLWRPETIEAWLARRPGRGRPLGPRP